MQVEGKAAVVTGGGTGLGLAIVIDLANLYNGSLTLHRSSIGGLDARLELPFAREVE